MTSEADSAPARQARSAIAAAGPAPDQVKHGLDDHQALEYMHRILDQLAADRAAVNP
jgi:hypothetical protein